MDNTQLEQLTAKAKRVMAMYQDEYPDVHVDRDYFPLKVAEEWGECPQVFLMLSDRGRQKGKTKDEIRSLFAKECADVFGYLLLFADREGVDLAKALEEKWFAYLKN